MSRDERLEDRRVLRDARRERLRKEYIAVLSAAGRFDALTRLLIENGCDWRVFLEYGPRRTDDFGRILAYLWVQDAGATGWLSVDELLVGFGYTTAWAGDGQYTDGITDAEFDATERCGSS